MENNFDYKLIFEFGNNDYFNNKILEKTFRFDNSNEENGDDECDIIKSEGTEINWKPNKNIVKKIVKKKQLNKKTGA